VKRIIFAIFVMLVSGAAVATTLNFDLAADWSDQANPFGPWSLWKSPTALFAVNQTDYFQNGEHYRAWADQPFPELAHVPVWARDSGTGDVWMHGAEFDRTGTNLTSAVWTSPGAGVATIDGAVWQGSNNLRSMRWMLVKNDVVLTSGDIFTDGTYVPESPFWFASGSGGPGALVQAVAAGDRLELRMQSLSEGGNLGDGLNLQLGISLDVATATPEAPAASLRLQPCFPNPFNPRTTLRCDLPAASLARLGVYDAAGRRIRMLLAETIPVAGRREVNWDGLDDAGRACPSGLYVARLCAGGETAMVRMTLVR
jgi:hypothetical protein